MDALRVARVDNVQLDHFVLPETSEPSPPAQPIRRRRQGTLHLTPHHLIFSEAPNTSTSSGASSPAVTHEPEIWIPYPSITLLTRLPQSLQGLYPLRVETRYFNNYVLLFERDREGGAEDVWQSVKDCAVKTSVEQLHAFFYHDPHPSGNMSSSASASNATAGHSGGWNIYNPRNEFARQGLGTRTKAWRFTDINKDYSFSPTYPNKVALPTRISDSTLSYAAKYRSKARIPALSYLHWANSASITRSSQPMVGLKNSRSAQDERLVECIFSTHLYPEAAYTSPVYGATTTNLIIDARPTTNAMANVAMGAGTENMENYKSGKKAYLGIDNIHVMRNSLKMIIEAIREAETKSTAVLDRGLLRKSNWLRHISTILDGALIIIRNIHLNASHVLIHCSDGWDRTAQLSAVAQLSLDPYFRTIDGLAVLIEKDFLSFGHKFLDRSGHLSSDKYFIETEENEDSEEEGVGASKAAQAFFASVQKQFQKTTSHLKEISPVFHQFLECVRQIQRQFPDRFEFNEQYLLDLYYHLYSCQFGTFLFNNERERQTSTSSAPYVERTASVWSHLHNSQNRDKYLNPSYDATLDKSRDDQGVLLYDPREVKFWFRLFRRGDEEMNGSPLTLAQAQGAEVSGPIGSAQEDPIVPSPLISGIARAVSPPTSSQSGPATNASVSTSDLSSMTHATNLLSQRSTTTPVQRKAVSGHGDGGIGGGGGGGGWGWGQFSSGAFSAVTSAAREIKSISQEAYAQLKAEANEVDGDWGGNDQRSGTGGSSNGPSSSSAGPSTALGVNTSYTPYTRQISRLPSESNPWSTDPAKGPSRATPTAKASDMSLSRNTNLTNLNDAHDRRNHTIGVPNDAGDSGIATGLSRPTQKRIPSSGNPWATSSNSTPLEFTSARATEPARRTSPAISQSINSLNDLTLKDAHAPAQRAGTATTGAPAAPVASEPITNSSSRTGSEGTSKDKDEEAWIRAAMGDDKKAWDPLGAL